MDVLLDRLRSRLVPAILFAIGVASVSAGLLTYSNPVVADPGSSASPEPTIVETLEPSPSPATSASPAPTGSPMPSGSPSPAPVDRVATRVVVPALGIDLPVVKPPEDPEAYPYCNVAMYHEAFGQPGQPGATYLYAHAREGMFLPLLEQSKVNNGKAMLGMIVQVYTSDDMLFLYEIRQVRRHQTSLDAAFATTQETLWLQTSEGPKAPEGVVAPKLQVVAWPISSGPADPADAHPKAKPVVCG